MHRIAVFTAQLKIEVVHMAALSEPRGPLGQVTQDTYFSGLGLASLTQWLSLLPRMFARHVNRSLKHIWVDIQASTEAPPILCLAVYGLRKLVDSSERLAFWRQCVQDFQFFVYPGPVAQQWSHIGWRHQRTPSIFQWKPAICRRRGKARPGHHHCAVGSSVPQLKSGTSLNRIGFSPQLHADVVVQPADAQNVPRDHLHVFVTFTFCISTMQPTEPVVVVLAGLKRSDHWSYPSCMLRPGPCY